MKPSRLVSPLALALLALAVGGCPLNYLDLYEPGEGVGAVAGTGGAGGVGGGESTGATGGAGGMCAPGSVTPCYDGPPGTEGHGLCQAGSKTCNAEGTAYGSCTGEVTPTLEDCATATDEDCDGLAPPCKGTPIWSKRAGNANDQFATDVAVDSMGNALVIGTFAGTLDLIGCPALSTIADFSLFVAKLDPTGKCLWSKSADNANGYSVAVDGADNVLVTGPFIGAMTLSGCSLSNDGGVSAFVAKLDSAGACVWSTGAENVTGYSVAGDSAGNAFVAGTFTGKVNLGGCALSHVGGPGLFVAKLDPSGACGWAKDGGDATNPPGKGLALDGLGNILMTGSFIGAMDFGGCKLVNSGSPGLFVAKLDPTGACLWSTGADGATGVGAATDSSGNTVVTGFFADSITLAGCSLLHPGGQGLFVAKLDPSGTCLWSKGAEGGGMQLGTAVAVDGMDNVLLTGDFSGAPSFGGGSLASAGKTDVFLVKFDGNQGDLVWSLRGGGSLDDFANGVAVDSAGNVLITGYFSGTADFGTGPLVSAGGADIFVAKYSP